MKVNVDADNVHKLRVDEQGNINIGAEHANTEVEIAIFDSEKNTATATIIAPRSEPKQTYYDRHTGKKWEYARKAALERDGYECVACGVTHEEHLGDDARFGGLHVHHIQPVQDFEQPNEAHEIENLLSLCDEHHHKAELEGVLSVIDRGSLPEGLVVLNDE